MSLAEPSDPENMVDGEQSEHSEQRAVESEPAENVIEEKMIAPKLETGLEPPPDPGEENSEEMEEGEISDDEEDPNSEKKGQEISSQEKNKQQEASKSNDIEAFLKKKREDLEKKVKSQLELAGYKTQVKEEPAEKVVERPAAPEIPEKKSTSKKKSSHKSESRKSHRYHDLDPEPQNAADPQETMINSWLSGRKKDEEESGYDPNDEFYFGARVSPSNVPNEPISDKDYRTSSAREDKDYRWSQPSSRDFPLSDDSDSRRTRTSVSPDTSRSVTSNEYGDRDYRHGDGGNHRSSKSSRDKDTKSSSSSRRKRGTGDRESDEEEDRRFKRTRRSPSPTFRRNIRHSRWEGRPSICKFFRDGFCRDGDDCTYSHNAADSMRKGELCKYYQQGYCKLSRSCPFLHGEYPCKAFHKGECSKGNECPYSHTTLNEFTQPIYDQLLNDEDLASKIKIPQVPTKRKVLLGAPPSFNPNHNHNGPQNMMGPPGPMHNNNYDDGRFDGPMNNRNKNKNGPPMGNNNGPPMGNDGPMGNSGPPMGNNNGPPMGNNGPGHGHRMGNGPMLPMPPFMDMPGNFPRPLLPPPNFPPGFLPQNMPPLPPMLQQQLANDMKPPASNTPPVSSPSEKTIKREVKEEPESSESAAPYDIGEMLRKIKATVQAEEEPEESPASPPPATAVPLQGSTPQNIPFHGIPKYRLVIVDVNPPTVNPALLTKSLNDNKLRNDPRIKKLLESQFNAVSNMITSQKTFKLPPSESKGDPRSLARDPRLAKQGTDSPKMSESVPPISTPSTNSESDIQEMIKMQLQMTAAMGQQQMPPAPSAPLVNQPGMPSTQSVIVTPQNSGIGGPMLGGSNAPPMMYSGGMGGPMLGGGPMLNSAPAGGGGGWMPQFAGSGATLGMGMDLGFGAPPNTGIPPPGLIEGPVTLASVPPPAGQSSESTTRTKDPRNRSSRWNRSSPPSQVSPNYSENVPPTVPENFMQGDSSPNSDSKPVSLREKRKDNQYESPLAAGVGRVPGTSESSRYNEMPNVKVKRKSPSNE